MERWLALTVSGTTVPAKHVKRPPYFISIPKKIVKQAVRRNRLRRVLREALRGRSILDGNKRLVFRVLRAPEDVGLGMAKEAVQELLKNV